MPTGNDFDLNAILEKLLRVGPTDEERRQASGQAMARMGLGILSANQPSPTPRNPLGVLAQGGLQGMDAYQGALNQQMAERKAGGLSSLQALQIKKQIAQQDALARFAQGDQPTPQGPMALTAGAAVGDVGPTQTNLKRLDAMQATPAPMRVPNFGELLAAGVEPARVQAMMDEWKLRNPKLENVPGIGMVNPHTGGVHTSMPRITDTGRAAGAVPDGLGGWRVNVPQGSVGAYTQFQNADEEAKARVDPFLGQLDRSGRPIPQTRLDFVNRMSPRAAAEPTSQPGGVGMGPTPTQAAAATVVGKGDAERVLALEQKIPNMVASLRRLDRMEQLSVGDTYAAAGAEIKTLLGSVAQGFGLPVQKEKTGNTEEYIAHVAELLKDRLASKDYGSGTGISNLDLIAATKPLPELAKTETGRQQIIGAIRADTNRAMKDALAAREHFQQNMSLRGFKYPSELERPLIPKTPGQPAAMSDKPPAAQHRGRTIEDENGKRFKSDGMIWKPM